MGKNFFPVPGELLQEMVSVRESGTVPPPVRAAERMTEAAEPPFPSVLILAKIKMIVNEKYGKNGRNSQKFRLFL